MIKTNLARLAARLGAATTLAAAIVVTTLVSGLGYSQSADAMKIQTVKSPGGIEGWLVEEHSVPLIALRFAFKGGSAQDPDDKMGITNFITAMMDEGAGDLTSEQFQDQAEDIAMKMQFQDSKDALYGSLSTLSVNREKALGLLKLAVQQPRFDADAVERMRQQLLAGLAYAAKNPDKVAENTWFATAFEGHAYARPSSGTPQTIASISSADLKTLHKRTFARDNLKVVAVGDMTREEFAKMLDDVFGALPAKAGLTDIALVTPRNAGKQVVVEMPVPQSVAMFGLGAMARKDPDFMAAFVINHILGGGGFSAKLMEEVREKRGLAYSVYSYIQPFDHASVLTGSVATKNESMAESLNIIRAELTKMAEKGPQPEDLQAAKDYLTGSYALRFDTNSKIAMQLLGLQMEDFGPEYIETRNALIDAITLDDVKRVAKSLLKADDLIVTVVGQPTGLTSTTAVLPSKAVKPAATAPANPG